MRNQDDLPIRASLLDRLRSPIHPQSQKSGRQQLRELIASVHDHLEALLNTRWCLKDVDRQMGDLTHSLLNYGIPDFATLTVATPEGQQHFQQLMAEAIRMHEPRFINVQVEIVSAEEDERRLHFRISGDLRADPEPAHVAFDSMLDTTERTISVKASEYV